MQMMACYGPSYVFVGSDNIAAVAVVTVVAVANVVVAVEFVVVAKASADVVAPHVVAGPWQSMLLEPLLAVGLE